MGRIVTFSARQVKAKPRPLVGTKTFIKQTERDMRDQEWSDGFGGTIVRALVDNERQRAYDESWDSILNPKP